MKNQDYNLQEIIIIIIIIIPIKYGTVRRTSWPHCHRALISKGKDAYGSN
jgi:hypothetical protein